MLEREQENNWIVSILFSFNTDWLLEYYDLRFLHITCVLEIRQRLSHSSLLKKTKTKHNGNQDQDRSSNIIQSFAESKPLDTGLHQVVDGILHLQHHGQDHHEVQLPWCWPS